MNEARIKIDRCMTRLLMQYPFWGCLLLSMTVVETTKVQTMGTDGIHLYYNPKYVLEQDTEIVCTDLAHEGGHKAFMHSLRRRNRDHEVWNFAGDYAINAHLKASGLTLGHDYLYDIKYEGLDAEEIYELLMQNPQDQPQSGYGCCGLMDHPGHKPGNGQPDLAGQGQLPAQNSGPPQGHGRGQDASPAPGQGQPEEGMGGEAEALTALAQAKAFAKGQGKLPSSVEMAVNNIINPPVRWYEALQQFMERCVADDFTWQLPDRRFLDSDMYLPSLNSEAINTLAIGFDTSGSIYADKKLVDSIAEHISDITSMLPIGELVIVYADSMVQHVDRFSKLDMPVKLVNVKGGGGTKFEPVFEYLEREGITPKGLVYFTDLDGSFPQHAPSYPVLWASIKEKDVPFGEVLHINT